MISNIDWTIAFKDFIIKLYFIWIAFRNILFYHQIRIKKQQTTIYESVHDCIIFDDSFIVLYKNRIWWQKASSLVWVFSYHVFQSTTSLFLYYSYLHIDSSGFLCTYFVFNKNKNVSLDLIVQKILFSRSIVEKERDNRLRALQTLEAIQKKPWSLLLHANKM